MPQTSPILPLNAGVAGPGNAVEPASPPDDTLPGGGGFGRLLDGRIETAQAQPEATPARPTDERRAVGDTGSWGELALLVYAPGTPPAPVEASPVAEGTSSGRAGVSPESDAPSIEPLAAMVEPAGADEAKAPGVPSLDPGAGPEQAAVEPPAGGIVAPAGSRSAPEVRLEGGAEGPFPTTAMDAPEAASRRVRTGKGQPQEDRPTGKDLPAVVQRTPDTGGSRGAPVPGAPMVEAGPAERSRRPVRNPESGVPSSVQTESAPTPASGPPPLATQDPDPAESARPVTTAPAGGTRGVPETVAASKGSGLPTPLGAPPATDPEAERAPEHVGGKAAEALQRPAVPAREGAQHPGFAPEQPVAAAGRSGEVRGSDASGALRAARPVTAGAHGGTVAAAPTADGGTGVPPTPQIGVVPSPGHSATAASGAVLTPQSPGAVEDALPAPLGAPGWDEAFGQRLVWHLGRGQTGVRIRVNPPELGHVEVRLTVHQDQASVHFSAPSPQVREAVEAALPRLREMLAETGIQLADAGVSAQDSGGHGDPRDPAPARTFAPGGSSPSVEEAGSAPVTVRAASGLLDLYA